MRSSRSSARRRGALIAAFAAISALGALNGWVLCSGEVPLALARDGVFPAWFAETTRNGTPVRAQMLSACSATCWSLPITAGR